MRKVETKKNKQKIVGKSLFWIFLQGTIFKKERKEKNMGAKTKAVSL